MHNNLHHKEAFTKLLKSYKPSKEFIEVLSQIKLALLIAPAATGRNTIIKELVKFGNYHNLVSDTTRLMRMNDGVPETNGVEYWFKNEEVFLEELKMGNYLGPAIIHEQQVSGVHLSELRSALMYSKIAITDMDIQGADEIKTIKRDSMNIYLLPPTFEEWMRRMQGRGVMEKEERSRRLKSAIYELEEVMSKKDVTLFINDDLNETVTQIHNFILKEEYVEDANKVRDHARDILLKLKDNISGTLDA